MRIAVVNTKGGVGKSTLACHLAAMLAAQGPTLLIDSDPQQSAASWAAWRRERVGPSSVPHPTTVCLNGQAVYVEGRALAAGFMHTVVDAGGRDSGGLRGALLLAERAIVPVQATSFESAALASLIEIAQGAREINSQLWVRFVLSMVNMRTRDAAEMLAYLRDKRQLEVLDAVISDRVAYHRATGDGLAVEEVQGSERDGVAAAEMAAVFEEITR